MFNKKLADLSKWDRRYLLMARDPISTWSKDPSTKVGAVLVRPNNTVHSTGYNGLPRGLRDDPELLADRMYKYPRTLHAEVNAILNADTRPVGCTLFIWPMPPCSHCAIQIIQSGITRVVAPEPIDRWYDSCLIGDELLQEAGVTTVWLNLEGEGLCTA